MKILTVFFVKLIINLTPTLSNDMCDVSIDISRMKFENISAGFHNDAKRKVRQKRSLSSMIQGSYSGNELKLLNISIPDLKDIMENAVRSWSWNEIIMVTDEERVNVAKELSRSFSKEFVESIILEISLQRMSSPLRYISNIINMGQLVILLCDIRLILRIFDSMKDAQTLEKGNWLVISQNPANLPDPSVLGVNNIIFWLYVKKKEDQILVEIQEVYWNPGMNGVGQNLQAVWSREGSFYYFNRSAPGPRDLGGLLFRMAICTFPPFSKVERINNTAHYVGYYADILAILSKNLNFTYKFTKLPPNCPSGALNHTTNEWDQSFIRWLIEKEVDFVPYGFMVTPDRRRAADFTSPVAKEIILGVARKRSIPVAIDLFMFTKPFEGILLVSIGMILAAAAVSLTLTRNLISPKSVPKHVKRPWLFRFSVWGRSFCYAVYELYTHLIQMGNEDRPGEIASCIILFCFLCFSLLIYSYYTSMLTSFLTVETVDLPFSTFAEAMKRKDYAIGLYDMGIMTSLIQQTQDAIWQRTKGNLIKDIAQAVKIVDSEKMVFVTYRTPFEFHLKSTRRFCDFAFLPRQIDHFNYRFAFPKNSPYTKLFSSRLERLSEAGVFQHLANTYLMGGRIACQKENAVSAINLGQLSAPLIIMVLSVIFAFIALKIERRCKRKRVNHKPTRKPPIQQPSVLFRPRAPLKRYYFTSAFINGAKRKRF